MYRFKVSKLVGALIPELEHEALASWLDQHGAGMDMEQALNSLVREIHTHVLRRRGGNISVTVSILAKQPWDSDVYWFPLQTRGNTVVRVDREP